MNLLGLNSMKWGVCSLSTWGPCPLSAQISVGSKEDFIGYSTLVQASCMLGSILSGGKPMRINKQNQITDQSPDSCELKECVSQLVSLFMNREYDKAERRSLSIIQPPFIQHLDPMSGQPYPIGYMGSYVRLAAENLEAFVNIGTLISRLRSGPLTGNLLTLMEA
ncbi:MAG: hypothetical protein ABH871_08255, partial [Pseudomonadota bacterium]